VSPWGRRLAIAVIAFQVLVPVALMLHFSHPFANSSRSDAARYQAIAVAPGRAYVDHPAEYPHKFGFQSYRDELPSRAAVLPSS